MSPEETASIQTEARASFPEIQPKLAETVSTGQTNSFNDCVWPDCCAQGTNFSRNLGIQAMVAPSILSNEMALSHFSSYTEPFQAFFGQYGSTQQCDVSGGASSVPKKTPDTDNGIPKALRPNPGQCP